VQEKWNTTQEKPFPALHFDAHPQSEEPGLFAHLGGAPEAKLYVHNLIARGSNLLYGDSTCGGKVSLAGAASTRASHVCTGCMSVGGEGAVASKLP
jgi:hypothetical protein